MNNHRNNNADTVDGSRLAVRGISKTYGALRANDDLSITIAPGSIHALLGENGAGKSTLVKTIYGLVKPDAGTIYWQGQPVTITRPNVARRLGIGMVFQHFSLFESLTVLENIMLGIDKKLITDDFAARIVAVSKQYGLPLDPHCYVHDLSVGERQRIEIVRCLLQSPKLLIMDEPTSVLTPQEVESLFVTLRRLAAEGVSVLYISHKLAEIRTLCDVATIMRAGRVIASCDPQQQSAEKLAELMIGTLLTPPQREHNADSTQVRLHIQNLSMPSLMPNGISLDDITMTLCAGQILGVAGVAGNGQIELMRALIGETRCRDATKITINGAVAGQLGPVQRRRLGAAFVPEERVGHGAVPTMPLWENALLSGIYPMRLSRSGFIRTGATHTYTRDIVQSFDVRTQGIQQHAGSLSGGNLQKFILAVKFYNNQQSL